jgi:hypothetical protein
VEDQVWRASASAAGFDPAEFETYNEYLEALAQQRRRKRKPFDEAVAAAGVAETYDRATGKRTDDPRLFELAITHLRSGAYDDETRGWIARMCETRAAKPYWAELEGLFRAAPEGSDERDGLAAALSAAAGSKHLEQMMALVEDPQFGRHRIYFLRPINRLGQARGKAFVAHYVDDPVLGREASAIIRGWSRNQA